jgi:hypothetical protein
MSIQLPDSALGDPGSLKFEEKKTSISLTYWHASSQCISEWNNAELKKLRKAIDKIQSLTPTGVRTDPGLGFKFHGGPAKGAGFSRPQTLPKDFSLCEVRVSDKARLHGTLRGSDFFLVWLDRGHAVFPSGK